MNPDIQSYFHFTGKSRLQKSINSLLGLIEGIAIDGQITPGEVSILRMWLSEHRELAHRHPYNELVPRVAAALEDGVLDAEERQDITWLCERLRSTEFSDMVSADMQRLHALVGGIAADGTISVKEMRGLSDWLGAHEHLKTCWPYDEIEALTTRVLADGQIDPAEHKMLLSFFTEFLALLDERTIVSPIVTQDSEQSFTALCAVNPNVTFRDATFCFTGASAKYKRADFERTVQQLGGQAVSGVTAKLKYLVIGADGNPCWAYACYGRKVEKAVELRKKGVKVVLLHENDFHDAVLDS
jgi:NAD-dependent DNA ligase